MTTLARSRRAAPPALAMLVLALPMSLPAAEPAASPAAELEEARRRLDEAVREVTELSGRLGARMGDRFTGAFVPPRAVIGVQVQSGEARDAARVTEVSPGGAAQAAGLREGDEILAVDGRELGAGGDPAAALVAITRELEPEKAVKLRVRRDGRNQEIEVRPRPAPRTMVLGARPGGEFRFAGPPGDIRAPVAGVGPMLFEFEHLAPLAGMELATLSERLGSYFGAKEGVLVVRAGNQDAWKLQDGDVILSIDGREPESAAHATRILRSYHRGEKLQIKVLRQRRNETLDVTLPEAGPRGPGGEGGAVRRE